METMTKNKTDTVLATSRSSVGILHGWMCERRGKGRRGIYEMGG